MMFEIMIVFFFTQRVFDAVQRAACDRSGDDNAKEVDKKIPHRATPPFGMDSNLLPWLVLTLRPAARAARRL